MQRVTIPEAAHIKLRRGPLDDEKGHERTPFLTGAQDSHLQRVTIPEAAHIQLRRGAPDDEQG